MITNKTIAGVAGAYSVFHPSIAGVTILGVHRSGMTYRRVTPTPGNMEFVYIGGIIAFQNPFNSGEKVFVLYQT